MRTGGKTHKHVQLKREKDQACSKNSAGQTETETIERALDLAIAEHRRNRSIAAANERFIQSGIEIEDVYGSG